MTQEFLQDALVADLRELFRHYTLVDSIGLERPITVYPQDLPIRSDEDEEDPPEPYVVVKLTNGELTEQGEPQSVEVVLVICVQDPDPNRRGYRDALHIINEITRHYAECDIVGKRYQVKIPIKWAVSDSDTHPYYFAAMGLSFEAPALFKELPET